MSAGYEEVSLEELAEHRHKGKHTDQRGARHANREAKCGHKHRVKSFVESLNDEEFSEYLFVICFPRLLRQWLLSTQLMGNYCADRGLSQGEVGV